MLAAGIAKIKSALKLRWVRLATVLGLVAGLIIAGVVAMQPSRRHVVVNGQTVYVELADTPDLQTKGLSGHVPLESNQGMLFVFRVPGTYCFWMKDMQFPIDIIWISADKQVVKLERNLDPATYPQEFCPEKPALYTLELPAGAADRLHVQLGQHIDL